MTISELASELSRKYPGRVLLLEDQRTLLVTSPTASRTLTVEVGDDSVRISAGRVVHAEVYEERSDLIRVIGVTDAILRGCAEELYGSTSTGVVGFIGYRISGLLAPVTRMDEPAKIVHVATL